jgi:uncharacterized lipoprotein YajG
VNSKQKAGAIGMAALALAACSTIRQEIKPVEKMTNRLVCIVEDKTVKASFLEAYKKALTTKGYYVRQLPPLTAVTAVKECPVTSTYKAVWRWDVAPYMAYAEILVYDNGALAGEARHDAQSGSINLDKYFDSDDKIRELVNRLFPGVIGSQVPAGN